VVVDNKPGASGTSPPSWWPEAQDDNHTLVHRHQQQQPDGQPSNIKLLYNPTTDFAPISDHCASGPGGAIGLPAAPSFLRPTGDRWNYSSVGNGSVATSGWALLKLRTPGSSALQAVHMYRCRNAAGGNRHAGRGHSNGAGWASRPLAGKLRAGGITSGLYCLAPSIAR
jgi:hypothetical protein